jgi:hypothetical protein
MALTIILCFDTREPRMDKLFSQKVLRTCPFVFATDHAPFIRL